MFIAIDFKRFLKIFLLLLLVTAALVFLIRLTSPDIKDAIKQSRKSTLVIDAGHGGIDGGAISASGIKESDINLAIALKTDEIAQFFGVNTVLTRSSDTDNSEDKTYSEHNNLIARAEIANSAENAVLISIHQNKFPSELVSGAEVMYSAIDGSKELGLITQDNLVSKLDPSNRRVARPAPSELLLTSSAKCPSILVECGFMSNPEEVKCLSDDTYQTKIAAILTASYIQYLNNSASA